MMGPSNAHIVGGYIALIGMVRDQSRLVIRHDVDHDILKAFEMAMLESEHGIKSTYYLLPTAPYFDYSDRFVEEVEGLAQLGHMIGLHNNALTEHIQDLKPLTRAISEPLDFLRKCVGTVSMTAAHGDRFLKPRKLINFQMWKECDDPWNGPTLSLKKYGLSEAYFTESAYYLSDTGGKWRGGLAKHQAFESDYEPCNPIQVIQFCNSLDEGDLHLLIHPYWWS